MKEEINVLIKEDEIVARVKELAEQINRDYEGKTLHLICILKGSVFFTCELAKYITVPVTIDFMSVSSYGNGMTSSGSITISQDLIMSLENREVLIVEDIVRTHTFVSCPYVRKTWTEKFAHLYAFR